MKRVLQILLILLAGGLLAFAFLGLFVREVSISSTVVISAPVEDAWSTFLDMDRLDEWVPGYDRLTVLSGDAGQAGSQCRLYFDGGRAVDISVSEAVPHSEYSFDFESASYSGRVSAAFEESESATVLTHTVYARGHSFLNRARLPVVKPAWSLRHMAALDNLEAVVERRPSSSGAPGT